MLRCCNDFSSAGINEYQAGIMKMKLHRFIFILVQGLFIQLLAAQETTTIRAAIDKNKIYLGEPIRLSVEAVIPASDPIRFIEVDSIDHFELLNKPVIDTINTTEGTTIKGVYTITSFDSGHWVLPAFILGEGLKTDSLPVDVVFSEFNPEQDYHDVKNIIEVKPGKKIEWWYAVIAGAASLLVITWLITRKKKPVGDIQKEIPVDPYEEARLQLLKLRSEKYDTKEYYTRISDIFRLYIYRKKGILSLQKTTDDLVSQLKNVQLNKEQFENLSQSLQLSDFVKFAKFIPTATDNNFVYEAIKNSIEMIEKNNG
jgi:hypothetical protein